MIEFSMRNKKTIETIKISEGEYLEREFDNYIGMVKGSSKWTLFCPYQLKKTPLLGLLKF